MINDEIIILAIESSGSACGIAITFNDSIVCEYSVYNKNLHDRLLAEFIKRAMKDCLIGIENIDAIAVSAGPGSFTGLRIGASIAKGLCFGGQLKLISVPTLNSLVFSQLEIIKKKGIENIFALLPSHKNFYYLQEFTNRFEELTKIKLIELENIYSEITDKFVISGTEKIIFQKNPDYMIKMNLSPVMIAHLGYKYFNEGLFVKPDEYIPLYVQDFILR